MWRVPAKLAEEAELPQRDKRTIRFPINPGKFVPLQDVNPNEAKQLLSDVVRNFEPRAPPLTAAFLNMRNHTAATRSDSLAAAFCAMDYVFADGVGLQLGRQLLRLQAFPRVSGTEIVPTLLRTVASRGCRVFLLGGTATVSAAAAERLPKLFPGIHLTGFHHGYFDASLEEGVITQINNSRCDVLLIGMGTPTQELWLHRNRARIRASLVVCVGGLFHYWSSDLIRAPRVLSQAGLEWLWILIQQPFKWRVYTIGAVRFCGHLFKIAVKNRSVKCSMAIDFDITRERFIVKKIARRAVISIGRLIRAVHPGEAHRVRVLVYHRFGGSRLDPCSIDAPIFHSHLEQLAHNDDVITPSDFADVVEGNKKLSKSRILITVDDGHVSVSRHALPALEHQGMHAILFVCPGLIEAESAKARKSVRQFMDWGQLEAARAAGHVIAPHGLTHRSLGQIPMSEALDEIERSTSLLERRLGIRTPFFSFPFGTPLDYSEPLLEALWHSGYRYCFSSMHGACIPASKARCYPRLKIEGGPERDLFPHILRGCLDYWNAVDKYFYRFQQRGRL